jgi:hypothetical protein
MVEAMNPRDIVGWGVDADPANNPTYPQRDITKDDKSGMSWHRPPLQVNTVEILKSTERPSLSAVFGTAQPPKGLSGAIRRRAFKKSEGKWGHWLLLIAADRVDVIEGIFGDIFRMRSPFVRRSSPASGPTSLSRSLSLVVTLSVATAALYLALRR